MRRIFRSLAITSAMIAATFIPTVAQTITPVDTDPTKPRQPVLHYYDKHGEPLDEPVLFLADLDTVKAASPKPVYPLLYSATVGFNFFDAIMKMAGQKHASFDVWAALSLHNWFEPVVELGIGYADNKPEDGNFHYKGKPSFYGKIGLNYNFLYKSDPDYQVFLGLRGGLSSFRYEITDITINSSYWDQSNNFSILEQKAHALYGEVLAGIKVNLWNGISMGWSVRYRMKFKNTNGSNSTPWFIPGYGTNAPLSMSFSISYTMPFDKLRKKKKAEEPTPGDSLPAGNTPSTDTPTDGGTLPEIEPLK